MNTSDLLNELRIERHDREDRGGSGRWAWVAGAVVAAVLVLIEEGDYVEQGQVLARLEDSSQLAQLHATQAAASAALSTRSRPRWRPSRVSGVRAFH